MTRLAREIATIVIDEHGSSEFLHRISDPYWFQALGCALGYDWHSSGVTTVLTGVLKNAVVPEELGVGVCGGKGKTSKQTPSEIQRISQYFHFSWNKTKSLQCASRMTAKVDSAAIQAGYHLYHHAFFVTEDGDWVVIQQGMCPNDRTARRYHWLSTRLKSMVIEPHNAIVGDVTKQTVLDMTAKASEGCRRASVDIVKEPPKKTMKMIMSIRPSKQKSLQEWLLGTDSMTAGYPSELSMPLNVNWKTLQDVYEFQPRNYEELLGFRGVGPATVRALALVSELIYGEGPSWKDPIKYSFAYGGKDGVPHPVNRKAMDESIDILRRAIDNAKIGDNERMNSLKRLRIFVCN